MAGHNRRERALFTDVYEKNRLVGELRRLTARARRWRVRVRRRGSKRWQAQYRRAIARAEARIRELRGELLVRAEDLKSRIQEEQKVSKTEVQTFEKQYEKELVELREAGESLARAEAALAEAEAQPTPGDAEDAKEAAELLDGLRRRRGRARRKARREGKDVEDARREIASEERDHEVLVGELRRAIAEIASLRG